MRRPSLRAASLVFVCVLVCGVLLDSADAWAWTCPDEPEAYRRCIKQHYPPDPLPAPTWPDLGTIFLTRFREMLFGGLSSLFAALILGLWPKRALLRQPETPRFWLALVLWVGCAVVMTMSRLAVYPGTGAIVPPTLLCLSTICCWLDLPTDGGVLARPSAERRAKSLKILKIMAFTLLPTSLAVMAFLVSVRAKYGVGHPSQLQALAPVGGWALGFALIWVIHEVGAEAVASAWHRAVEARDAKLRRRL